MLGLTASLDTSAACGPLAELDAISPAWKYIGTQWINVKQASHNRRSKIGSSVDSEVESNTDTADVVKESKPARTFDLGWKLEKWTNESAMQHNSVLYSGKHIAQTCVASGLTESYTNTDCLTKHRSTSTRYPPLPPNKLLCARFVLGRVVARAVTELMSGHSTPQHLDTANTNWANWWPILMLAIISIPFCPKRPTS